MKYRSASPVSPASSHVASAPPTRRAVLRGAGGVAVALPLLQSLYPRGARAATPGKRFVAFTTEHGGINGPNMVPGASIATQTANLWHKVKHGPLSAAAKMGANTVLSPVLTAPSSVLTDKLLGKMNVMMGWDIPMYLGHHTGGHLGDYVRSDQGPKDLRSFPTIDQVMAWSPRFYTNTTGITQRAITAGNDHRGISWGWSNAAAQSGTVQKVSVSNDSKTLFDKLFAGVMPPPAGTPPPAKRPPVVDRILKSYQSLRSSNRRLSTEDKRRLDDHIAALAELDRRISQQGSPTSRTCTIKQPAGLGTIEGSRGVAENTADYKLINDVVVLALGCGVSRVATICVTANFTDYQGDWHQEVAHQHTGANAQAMMVQGLRTTFQSTILDFAAKLDAYEDSPGVSALDNSLVQWTQESGIFTHDCHAMTVVTFGNAGGFFKTGQFVDFRSGMVDQYKQEYGIMYRQWLANVLLSMGIPTSEFEYGGQPGYGEAKGWGGGKLYSPDIFPQTSKLLPLVTNG